MKDLLYVYSGLLVVIWIIVLLGFISTVIVHLLLILAAFIILARVIFNKQLSGK